MTESRGDTNAEPDMVPDPVFEEEIRAARQSLQRSDEAYARFKAAQRDLWEKLAGAQLNQMLQSRESTEAHLNDQDSRQRIAALFLLADHWEPDAKLARRCEELLNDDPASEVRAVALQVLACCYAGTDDARVGQMIARLVRDVSAPTTARKNAYLALLHVRGIPAQSRPNPLTFDFPGEVDWDMVDSFLTETVGKSPAQLN